MEQNELKNLLSELEADNTAELNSHTAKHHFSKSFERRAISTFRGAAAAFGLPCRRRHLPLWASGPTLSGGWGNSEWMNTPVFTLKTDKGEY